MTSGAIDIEPFLERSHPEAYSREREHLDEAVELQQDIASHIDAVYDPKWRERAAEVIAKQAAEKILPAYRTPHVTHATRIAARMALGLEALKPIDEEQGER